MTKIKRIGVIWYRGQNKRDFIQTCQVQEKIYNNRQNSKLTINRQKSAHISEAQNFNLIGKNKRHMNSEC